MGAVGFTIFLALCVVFAWASSPAPAAGSGKRQGGPDVTRNGGAAISPTALTSPATLKAVTRWRHRLPQPLKGRHEFSPWRGLSAQAARAARIGDALHPVVIDPTATPLDATRRLARTPWASGRPPVGVTLLQFPLLN